MELQQLQNRVDDWIKNHGVRYFNELTNMAMLTEEVGEVARIIARRYGEQSEKESDKNKDLGEELSDVLFVLLCLANSTKTDLQTAFDKKMLEKTKRDHKRHFQNEKLSMILPKKTLKAFSVIEINTSKSLSNRFLVLQKLFPNSFEIKKLSNAQDTLLLQDALKENHEVVDVNHAGTSIRFLLAYYAFTCRTALVLTGSERLKQRPIKDLVKALRNLGAQIEYTENEGFPPIKILPAQVLKTEISISAHTSSQFISALMLVGSRFEKGLILNLKGKITSKPYIEMTQWAMQSLGINVEFQNQRIVVHFKKEIDCPKSFVMEGDWSAASYFYSMVAFAKTPLILKTLYPNSVQGDSGLVRIFEHYFGVKSQWKADELHLIPITDFVFPEKIELDLNHCPDIAQSLCVIAALLEIPFRLTGLETLKIKETDRLVAMQTELKKMGTLCQITESSIASVAFGKALEKLKISTYKDHRMAMAFAVYALKNSVEIEQPMVVEKSYPNFWKDFEAITQNSNL